MLIENLKEKYKGENAIKYCAPAFRKRFVDRYGNVSTHDPVTPDMYYSNEIISYIYNIIDNQENVDENNCILYESIGEDAITMAQIENEAIHDNFQIYIGSIYILHIKNPEALFVIKMEPEPVVIPLDMYATQAGIHTYGETKNYDKTDAKVIYSSCYMESYVSFSLGEKSFFSYVKYKDKDKAELVNYIIYGTFPSDFMTIQDENGRRLIQLNSWGFGMTKDHMAGLGLTYPLGEKRAGYKQDGEKYKKLIEIYYSYEITTYTKEAMCDRLDFKCKIGRKKWNDISKCDNNDIASLRHYFVIWFHHWQ